VYDEEGIPTTRTIAVNDKATLGALIKDLKKAKRASVEFGGLYMWDDTFRLSALNLCVKPGLAYVVPLWTNGSRWKDPQKILNILKPHLESMPYWYMQNGKFDEKCLEVLGVSIRQDFDTMGAAYALDENNKKDLGFLAPWHKYILELHHTRI